MSAAHVASGSLHQALAERWRLRSTGNLTATISRLKRIFCLEQGWIVYAASNVIEEQFDRFALKKRLLSRGDHAVASAEATRQQKPFLAYLASASVLRDDQLAAGVEQWVRDLLFATLDSSRAEVGFSVGTPNLAGLPKTRLCPVALVLDHSRGLSCGTEELRAQIGPPDIRLAVGRRADKVLQDVPVDDNVRFLLSACDGSRELSAALQDASAAMRDVVRSAYALVRLGVLEESRMAKPQPSLAREQATRSEALARLNRAEGADHYTILGIERTAEHDRIREAYYVLARRFHPDRFRSGPLQDLLPQIERYFGQVTEAYNTLVDREQRDAYDAELSQKTRVETKKAEPEQDAAYLAKQNFAKARVLIGKRRLADAVTFLQNAIELDPTQAIYFLELGRALARNPRFRDQAEAHLNRATALDPTMIEAYLALAELHAKAGRTAEATSNLREVLRWDPAHAEALAELKRFGQKA